MREMLPVGAIMLGGGDVMGMVVAVLVFPSVVLGAVGAALGIWRPSALDRAAGLLTGMFSGTVTGVIGSALLSAYALEYVADIYVFLIGAGCRLRRGVLHREILDVADVSGEIQSQHFCRASSGQLPHQPAGPGPRSEDAVQRLPSSEDNSPDPSGQGSDTCISARPSE